ncbi:MAG: competence/damage-inducible protein A [Anaerofustis sp.]
MTKAVILAVGDEVLTGEVVNTNGAYLSKSLDEIGIEILYQHVIADDAKVLSESFLNAFAIADIVITSGGMGPTKDDLTKETIAVSLETSMVLDPIAKQQMEELFKSRGYSMTDNNLSQCMLPLGSEALKNDNGTAPGIYWEIEGKVIIMLPGPPRELEPMFFNYTRERLLERTKKTFAEHYYMTCGFGESQMESELRSQIEETAAFRYNTYLTQSGVMVKAIAKAESWKQAHQIEAQYVDQFRRILGNSLYSERNEEIWVTAARYLMEQKITIASAESCTGGLFGAYLTKNPGISASYRGGVISYDNGIKEKILGVSHQTLSDYGAVSEQTAREMANGVRSRFATDIGVGITGIAGPGGETPEKPIGLVYICVNIKGVSAVTENHLIGNREMVQKRSMLKAFQMLCESLNSD